MTVGPASINMVASCLAMILGDIDSACWIWLADFHGGCVTDRPCAMVAMRDG